MVLWLVSVITMLAFKPLWSPTSFGYAAIAYPLRIHTWAWSVINHSKEKITEYFK